MPKKSLKKCAECGKRPSGLTGLFPVAPDDELHVCGFFRWGNYDGCRRCGRAVRIADMRQSWCRWCRTAYDRDRWIKQREARAAARRPG